MANLVWGRQKSGLCSGERASYEGGKDELRMVQVKRRWEPPQYKSCLLVISGCLTPAHTPHSQSRIIKLLSHTTSQHTHTQSLPSYTAGSCIFYLLQSEYLHSAHLSKRSCTSLSNCAQMLLGLRSPLWPLSPLPPPPMNAFPSQPKPSRQICAYL